MILGRPTNLWLGFTTAVTGFGALVAVTLFHADGVVVATLAGGLNLLLGAGIALVSGQPPTLNPGDTFHVTTPSGQPNFETTVATPPKADAPPGAAAMKTAAWWYLIAMVGVGCSIAVMIWAASLPNALLTVLALLNGAYWGMAAFASSGVLRGERYFVQTRMFNSEDHIG